MLKPVKSVIAVARTLIRRPSEQKLATEDLRMLLHQALEELSQLMLKENKDYFTHEVEVALSYDSTLRGYTMILDAELSNAGVDPVFFLCQELTADQQVDSWQKIRVAKLSSQLSEARINEPMVSMIGNAWQGITGQHLKFSLTDEFIATQRWRLAFRYFPQEILDLDDRVPFPPEHMSLLEHLLAYKALPLVRDDSPGWLSFSSKREATLLIAVERMKLTLKEWLNKDVENEYITPVPYHYRQNNPLHRNGIYRRIRTEW